MPPRRGRWLPVLLVLVVLTTGLASGTYHSASPTDAGTHGTAPSPPGPRPDPATSGAEYCLGQRLVVSVGERDGTAGDGPYRFVSTDDTGPELPVDPNASGVAVLDTSGLSTGEFVLRGPSGETLVLENGSVTGTGNGSRAALSLRDCPFDARFLAEEVAGGREPGRTATLRVERTLTDQVFLRARSIPRAVLAGMVNGTVTPRGVRVSVPGDGRVAFTTTPAFVCQVGAGEYTVVVESERTGVERRANLTVTEPAEVEVAFADRLVRVRRGSTANVTVEMDEVFACRGNEVTLDIGGADTGFHARADVVDRTGDARVTVRVDTGRAGTAPASAFFRTAANDSLRNATLLSADREGAIAPGRYEMRLLVSGSEQARGTLVVVSTTESTPGTTDRQPSPTGSTPRSTSPVETGGTTGPGTETVTETPPSTSADRGTEPTRTTPATSSGSGPDFGVATTLLAVALLTVGVARRHDRARRTECGPNRP